MFSYFILNLKRIKKIFKNAVLISLCFCFVIITAGYHIIKKSNLAENKIRFSVGVTGSKNNNLLKLGMVFLKNMDDTRYVLDIREYRSEEDAKKALEKDEISAYAVIPSDFVDSLYYLQNDSIIQYYVKSGLKGISGVVMDEVASLASSVILYTEGGLFTLMEYMDKNHVSYRMQNSHIAGIFENYIKLLIRRGNISEVKVAGGRQGISLYASFLISLLLLYILLLSFVSNGFYAGPADGFFVLLARRGAGPAKQVASELSAVFLLNLALYFIFSLFLLFFFITGIFDFPEFGNNPAAGFFLFSIKMILCVLLFTGLQTFVYEAVKNPALKIIILFLVIFSFSFVSGYFYPGSFLPGGIRRFGEVLPTGTALSYAENILAGGKEMYTAESMQAAEAMSRVEAITAAIPGVFIIIYFLLFTGGAIFLRHLKIKKGAAS